MDWFDAAEDRLTRWKAREKAMRDFRNRFSPLAQKALDAAFDEARKLNFGAIGAEHLLLGLLEMGEGPVLRQAGRLGLSPEFVRSECGKMRVAGEQNRIPERLPFTPRMKRIVQAARREAQKQHRKTIDRAHLLAALVAEKEGWPAQLLRKVGIDREALRNGIFEESA